MGVNNMKKYFKHVLVFLFSLLTFFSIVSCTDNKNKTNKEFSDEEIINFVIDNFMPLSNVPRPSHHEEMIS